MLRGRPGTKAIRQDARCAFLLELTSALASANDESQIVGAFTLAATQHFSTTCAVHLIQHGGTLVLTGFAHQPPEEAARVFQSLSRLVASKLGPLQDSLRSGQAVVLAPAAAESESALEQRHLQERRLLEAFDGRAVIFVPLLIATTIIGVASFAVPTCVSQPDALEVAAATVASRHLALALENARSIEREGLLEARFVTLTQATHELLSIGDLESTYERVANFLAEGLAEYVVFYRVNEDRLQVIAVAHRHGVDSSPMAKLRDTWPLSLEAEADILKRLRTNPVRTALWAASAPMAKPETHWSSAIAQMLGARDEVWVPIGTGGVLSGAIAAYTIERPFGRGDVDVFEEVGQRASLAMDQAQNSARERRLTQLLQEAVLPAQLPVIKGAALSSVYSPAAIDAKVGGDWYDAFRLDEHRVLLTIGDVTGHGVEASVIMNKLRHTLNVVAMYEDDPAMILDAAETVLIQRFPNGLATAFVGIYDERDHSIVYANAGHPPPIVRSKDGSLRELDGGRGLPIGVRLTFDRSASSSAILGQVSLLALYTDGLIEASRDTIEGSRRLEECLKSDTLPYVHNAAAFVKAGCIDGPVPDDVAILVLMFDDVVRWAFETDDERAARECRATFISELRKRGISGGIDDAEIILGELLSNSRRHAPGPVDVALDFVGGKAIAHVIDYGPGMSGRRRQAPSLLNDAGRGLWIVQELGREVRIAAVSPSGTHISVVLPIDVDTEDMKKGTKNVEADR